MTVMKKFLTWFRKRVRPSLCADCKTKLDRKFHLRHTIKRTVRKAKHSTKRKLRVGVHKVKIRGKLRRVRVLRNGQWRFLK